MPELNQIREQAAVIAKRISNDAAFKAQVLSNPEATLLAAGMVVETIPEFLAEQQDREGRGYVNCGVNSCIVSKCTTTILEN